MNKYKIQTNAYITIEAEDIEEAMAIFKKTKSKDWIYAFDYYGLEIGKDVLTIKKI